jgi:hypothetical protein
MKVVTTSIDLEDDIAAWVASEAARRNISVSKLLSTLLAEKMNESGAYEQAMQGALEFRSFGRSTGPNLTRDEIYDRGSNT